MEPCWWQQREEEGWCSAEELSQCIEEEAEDAEEYAWERS
jgi:hypothetical protein